ncbi:MAG: S8 family serine peptidase [Bacteroidales bacterium]|jgi:subtilisin family serine protease|nr:S8 family serine peptidase [Bacteroidales bacterium]
MKSFFIICFLMIISSYTFSAEIYVKFKRDIAVPKVTKGQKKISAKSLPLSSKLLSQYNVAEQARSMSFMDNSVLERTFKISIPDSVDVDIFIDELAGNSSVEMVERVPENRIYMIPNDTFYGTVSGRNLKWHLDLINAEQAWDSAQGNPNIIVAVVDNAVYGHHEDLGIPDHLQYDMVHDTVGISYPVGIDPNTSLGRAASHGTHCAGNVGAISNNSVGIASLASGVTLMGCGGWRLDMLDRVINAYDGVIWAAEHGARVISCSWGLNEYSRTNEEIIRSCYEKGIVVVAAAGNDGISEKQYPAAYNGAIAVASVDGTRNLSYFSNYGKWVTIAAPGGYNSITSIFSTVFHYSSLGISNSSPFYQKRYDQMAGTSMACPIVASLVGLMLSKDSTLTVDQITTILQNSAQDKEFMNQDLNMFAGTIDAAAAISEASPHKKRGNAVRSLSADRIYFDSVCLKWSAPIDSFSVRGYVIYCNDVIVDSCLTDTVWYDKNIVEGTKEYVVIPVYYDSNVLQVRKAVSVDIPAFYSLTLSGSSGGTVTTYTQGYPRYEKNSVVAAVAIPDSGYVFVEWSSADGLHSANPYNVRMTKNISLSAEFEPLSSGIDDELPNSESVGVFPNPAGNFVTISALGVELRKIEIFDVRGRKVLQAGGAGLSESGAGLSGSSAGLSGNGAGLSGKTINISSLKSGIYLFRISTDRGIVTKKIAKR